ncbi:MAG: hypothetical protein AAB462_04660 [Patescibacteria group bacterium]
MTGNPAESQPPTPEQAISELEQARARVAAYLSLMPEGLRKDFALILKESVAEASGIERDVRRGQVSAGNAGFGGSSPVPVSVGTDKRPTEGVDHLANSMTDLLNQPKPQSHKPEEPQERPKTLKMDPPKRYGVHS